MGRNSAVLLSLLLLWNISGYCQQAFTFKFKTYSTNNGLVHNFTKKCLKDSRGFLWIITQHGLSRFDGVNFKNFEHSNTDSASLPENDLEDIAIDEEDNIWLSYKSGLCFYNQSTHKFTVIKNKGHLLSSWSVVYDKKRNCLWSASLEAYTKIEAKSLRLTIVPFTTRERFSPELNPMLLDSKDRLWIPYQRSSYHCIDTRSGKQYYHSERVEPTAFYEDDAHRIWMTTWQRGYREVMVGDGVHSSKVFGNPFLKIAENDFDFISQGTAQSDVLSGNNILWVINNTGGLLLFDKTSNKFIQHFVHAADDKNGLATDYNEAIYCDPTGIMWICTWHGLTKVNKQEQQFISKEIPWLNNLLYNCVAGIMDDPYEKDIAWLSANGSGITRFKKSTGEVLNKYFFYYSGSSFKGSDLNYNWRWTDQLLRDEANNIWTITYGGLVKISRGNVQAIPIVDRRKNFMYPFAIKQLGPGSLWLGCEKGLIRVNTANNSYTLFEDPNSKNSYAIGDIEQLNESTLLLSGAEGVRQFNTKLGQFSPYQPAIVSKDSVNERKAMSIKRIGKKLYMGTGIGLKLVDLESNKATFIGKDVGIDKLGYHRLITDKAGNLWIFTSGGLFKYNTEANNFEKFTTSDGIYDLSDDGVNMFEYNNYLYIGYRMAVTYFDPSQVNVNSVKVNPVITEVQVNAVSITQPLSSFETNELSLKHDENEIVIYYTAPDFTNADKITFSYQLEGYDKEWKQAGMRRRLTYNNLPPGEYRFKLRAANSSGLWNEKTAYFKFSIATPFWKSWWFRSLLVLSVLGLGYAGYRNRLQQLKKIYEVRSNISRSLHDEVGATLSSINIYSDVARSKTQDPSIRHLIDKVYDASSNAMENMSDIVWYVNPNNDRIENLLVRMREYALPLLEAKGINVIFDASENIQTLKTTMQQRQNFYLIFKEAINNCLKYAHARNVTIRLLKEENLVVMLIKDDGTGFDGNKNNSGNGIANMHFRATALGGKLEIAADGSPGTSIRLQFPIT
ncbi:MAG: hypothetical protein EOO06_06780 [Chitinophagaceae bacterium]|nr:MAG: hypothetical protein EOO06_06780 [Chitinophagaceae bacterium]